MFFAHPSYLFRTVVGAEVIFGDLGPGFFPKLRAIADALQTDPRWLLAVFASESTVNPSEINSIGATGLLQFTPRTLRETFKFKGTFRDFAKLTGQQQLDYVYQYFLPYRGTLKTPGRIYWLTYWPSTMWRGTKPDAVVTSSTADNDKERKAYYANQGLDIADPHGQITLYDLDQVVENIPRLPRTRARYAWALEQLTGDTPYALTESTSDDPFGSDATKLPPLPESYDPGPIRHTEPLYGDVDKAEALSTVKTAAIIGGITLVGLGVATMWPYGRRK